MFDFDEIETDVQTKGAGAWKEGGGGKDEKAEKKAEEAQESVSPKKPKQEEVTIRIGFSYRGQRWHEERKVKVGSTILELKKLLTASKEEEASWFQLMKGGLPAKDSDTLDKAMRLEFAYLPPRLPMEVLKPDMGEAPAGGYKGDMEVTVCFDPISGANTSFTVAKGSTISDLKQMMAKQDPTGSTQVEDFELAVNGAGGRRPLDGATLIVDGRLSQLWLVGPRDA